MAGNLAEFIEVHKNYKNTYALQGISFEIKKGKILGFLGPNGAGKTTTISILTGLIQDYRGKLLWLGEQLIHEKLYTSQKLGYMPQNISFPDYRTVYKTLMLLGTLSGIPREKLEAKINEVLQLLDLEKNRSKLISELSGGMKQKLGLAQAILHEPDLLILDEPFTGLDPSSRALLKSLLKKLNSNGMTIFFSSHILAEVEDIASEIIIINKGKIIASGDIDKLKKEIFNIKSIELRLSKWENDCFDELKIDQIDRIQRLSEGDFIIHLDHNADQEDITDKLIKYLIAKNCRISRIDAVSPNLEQIFLKKLSEEA